MDPLLDWVSQYGYAAIFILLVSGIVGLPVPDETMLVFCGYLVSKGKLHPVLTWLTAVCGSMCGISISYWIGRKLGLSVIHRYGKYIHLTEDKLDRVHAWFDRIGHWLLTIGYYIPGVRHFTALTAGISRMSFRSFMAFAYAGAVIWVSTFLSIGYFLGERWPQVLAAVHKNILIFTLIFVGVAVIVWLVRRRR